MEVKTGIFYGSTSGNTESVAESIAENLGAELFNVADASSNDFKDFDLLIFGTSTWGAGDLQDDWEDFISTLSSDNLAGKKVAIFGLGDAQSYCDTFVDGIGEIYETVISCNAEVIGAVSTEDYDYEESRAEVDGKFVGLPLDEDNESDKTQERIEAWVADIKSNL